MSDERRKWKKDDQVKWPAGGAAWAQGVVTQDEDQDGNVLVQPRSSTANFPGTAVQNESNDKRCVNQDEPEQSRRIWAPTVPLIIRCAAKELFPA